MAELPADAVFCPDIAEFLDSESAVDASESADPEAAAETTESEELAAAVDVNDSEDTESDAAPDICCMAENTSNMWESASGSVLFPFPSNGMASGGSICRIVCIFSIIFMDCFICRSWENSFFCCWLQKGMALSKKVSSLSTAIEKSCIFVWGRRERQYSSSRILISVAAMGCS